MGLLMLHCGDRTDDKKSWNASFRLLLAGLLAGLAGLAALAGGSFLTVKT